MASIQISVKSVIFNQNDLVWVIKQTSNTDALPLIRQIMQSTII